MGGGGGAEVLYTLRKSPGRGRPETTGLTILTLLHSFSLVKKVRDQNERSREVGEEGGGGGGAG